MGLELAAKSFYRIFLLGALTFTISGSHAAGLEAEVDGYDIALAIDQSTVINATLHNGTSAPLYVTGVQVVVSDNATADVYNPALLHAQLRQLNAGQTWDGPLVTVIPKHRGPLKVSGSVVLKGGASPNAGDLLASVPLHLTIVDPKREADGSFVPGEVPMCDRPLGTCCDPSEALCIQQGGRCVYVADGYVSQRVCVDRQAGKVYNHILNLQVSSDAAHVAYIAGQHCIMAGDEVSCDRVIVVDNVEHAPVEAPTHLMLSPDGRHDAYVGRHACATRLGEDQCTGSAKIVVDGRPTAVAPPWFRFPPDEAADNKR